MAAAPAKARKGAATPQGNTVRYEGNSGDWVYRCIFQDGNTASPPQMCSMEQALMLDKGKDSAPERLGRVFLVRLPGASGAKESVVWRLTLMTPLGTSLQEPVHLTINKGVGMTLPWQACVKDGCLSSKTLTKAELEAFRRGKTGQIKLKKVVRGDLTINLSLQGAGDAVAAMEKWGAGGK